MSNATIKKIHNEFDAVQENLVNAAKSIIQKGIYQDAQNAAKLKEFGFTACKEVKRMDALEVVKKDGEIAEMYAIKYPQYKFITKKEVDRICKKYGLYYGTPERYIGGIPSKNMAEIAAFKVKEEDMEEQGGILWSTFEFSSFWFENRRETEAEKKAKEEKEKKRQEEAKKPVYNKRLSICASKDMMNLKDARIEGNEIKEIVKDPIVLHPVKHGFMIVSKWGIEGEDEALTNQTLN